ncbi:SusC/RagA family TonB-linked outer membrane protein [Porifericola rhodea]|uniref:SusC/RagA family TonB-linked outer membrane protein n=1 Tax=Porifericola rhodea TaxID=930972 RepID=UPI002664F9E6|nr:SusC/RagA family TonB-linked outer membrane protein [Porifericola rhodea]WKN31953.1 SusC/RagA family TonB-linked outer membrane protein [Porifericola rhodea]
MKNKYLRKALWASRILLASFCMQLCMSLTAIATESNAQDAKSVSKVILTIDFQDEALGHVFNRIEKQTYFRFAYNEEDVEDKGTFSGTYTKTSLYDILMDISEQKGLKFRQVNKSINVALAPEKKEAVEQAPVLADIKVSGRVTDDSNQALPGVSVVVKGSTRGTTTDIDGNYSLDAPENGTLVFSFVGMQTREIAVNGRSTIDVRLQSDISSLNEVVVTALGITRSERSLGYATQEVKGENLTYTKEQNLIGSLAGRVAGVQVTGSSGASMGGTQKIKIRGVNSLSGNDQPLIVLDGTPMANSNFAGRNGADYGNIIQDINPDDIASVNVLKGPAASALYGLRGQHGVIMITTKKGQQGDQKVSVEYSGAFSVEKTGNFMPLQNIYGGGSRQSFSTLDDGTPYANTSVDESWGPKMDGTPVRQFYSFFPQDPDYGKLTPYLPQPDNIKDYYELGTTLNNTIAVNGGSESSSFRLSYNHTDIQGVEPNTWLKRNNLSFNGSLDIVEKLKLTTSLNYANNAAQRPPQGYDYGSTYLTQWFQRSVDMNKLKNYRYPDGTYLHWNLRSPSGDGVINPDPLYWNNPYFDAYESYSQDSRDRYFGNVGLTYQLLPELSVSGHIRSDMFTQNIDKRTAAGGRELEGYWVGKYQNQEVNYEFLAQYTKYWGKFSLNANLGANLLTQEYSYLRQQTEGGLSTPGFYNIAASVDRPSTTSYLRKKEIRSLFGMVSLGYNDIWFVDASLRNDNSSTLPENNNSYWYPSVSGSALFSELLDWEPLSLGKLRLSYAQAGSDLSPYQTAQYYGIGNVYATDSRTINTLYVPDELNNPDIKPSFSHSIEGGIDLRFFQNRLGIDFTLYQQRNRNQILSLPVSGASGYTSTIINAGLIENKGFELTLSADPIRSGKFNWNTNFNISRNRSMVKELYSEGNTDINNYEIASNTYSRVTSSVNAQVGEPYGTLIGQAYARDEASGMILLDEDNLPLFEPNHNFGSVLPDFTGGFQNTFTYGPFSFSALIDFQVGGQFFSWTQMLAVKTGQAVETAATNDRGNNVRDPLDEGGGVKVHGISEETGEEVTAYVDARSYFRTRLGTQIYEEWLYDASYIKMREMRLAYAFSKERLASLPFSSLSVGLIARYPFMIYQEAPKGVDPSELSTGGSPVSWLETGQLVTTRSYGISVNVTF